jgi:hypothetical protein
MMPVIAFNVLLSMRILTNAAKVLDEIGVPTGKHGPAAAGG